MRLARLLAPLIAPLIFFAAIDSAAEAGPDRADPMHFVVLDSYYAETDIFARGTITDTTAQAFQAFVQRNHIGDAIVRLDSGGGSVKGAIKLGRAIRALGFTTSIDAAPGMDLLFAVKGGDARAGACARFDIDPVTLKSRKIAGLIFFENTCMFDTGAYTDAHCLSACVFAFMGGVLRKLRIPEGRGLAPGATYHDAQSELGFHQFVPDAIAGLDMAGVSQLLSEEVYNFLGDMDIDRSAVNFANRAPRLSAGEQPFYYPTFSELAETGVVTLETLTPLRLVSDGDGLSLVSTRRNLDTLIGQISIGCYAFSGREPTMTLIVSSFYAGHLQPGVDRFTFGRPKIAGTWQSGTFLERQGPGEPNSLAPFIWNASGEKLELDTGNVLFSAESDIETRSAFHSFYVMTAAHEQAFDALGAGFIISSEIAAPTDTKFKRTELHFPDDVHFSELTPMLKRNCVHVAVEPY